MYNRIIENDLFKKTMKTIEEKEKNRIFCRHSIDHCLDVARIAYILTLENNLNINKDIIYSAALLHDTGRAFDDRDHDIKGAELAEKILIQCGYINNITEIKNAILNHRKSSASLNNLSDILSKADKLSRRCFDCKAKQKCYWSEERRNKDIKY